MDERYANGYGTRNYPFLSSEKFTYADLLNPANLYSNPTQYPTMRDVDALDARRPVPLDFDED